MFEERYGSLVKLLEDCPSSLVVDEEMPADEALKQHKRFFNQDLPDAVKSLQEVATQITQPDSQTLHKLKQVSKNCANYSSSCYLATFSSLSVAVVFSFLYIIILYVITAMLCCL